MTKILISFGMLMLASCTTISYRVIKEDLTRLDQKLVSVNKKVRLKTEFKAKAEDSIAREDLMRTRFYFDLFVRNDLQDWDHFDRIQDIPTEVEEKLHPTAYDDDYTLKVSLNEKIKKYTPNGLLRALTLGIYPERVVKKQVYSVDVTDRRTAQTISIKKNVTLEMSFRSFTWIIPFNWTVSPAGSERKAKIYKKLIMTEIKKMFRNESSLP